MNATPPNFEQAKLFLKLLDPTATEFCFQTFDDQKERKNSALTRVLNGTLEQHFEEFCSLSAQGAGIFVTVNATDGKGRRLANIKRRRAVFQEADEPGVPVPPLQPHIEVESSPGKFHRYLLIDSTTDPSNIEWLAVERRMVKDWGSDRNAKDLSRVLRLPGFPHQKNPEAPHMVNIVNVSHHAPYRWDDITEAIPPLAIERPEHATAMGKGIDCPLKLKSALGALNPDTAYDIWLMAGMAAHHEDRGGSEGFAIWDDWSSRGSLYHPGECEYKWSGFGNYNGRPVTIGTIFEKAKEAGWDWPRERAKLAGIAADICRAAIAQAATDSKAHLQLNVIEAFQILNDEDPLAYERIRTDLKKANKEIRLGALDAIVGRGGDGSNGKPNLTDELTELADNQCELWHDADGNAFASFDRHLGSTPAHREHWAIESRGFREWLAWLAYSELDAAPSSEALKCVQNALSGKAKFDGEQCEVALRIARNDAGYWIDLCDDAWRAILVTAAGWRIVDRPPIRFRRTRAMRPLPLPVVGGSLDPLWLLVNVPDDDRPFVLAWMLEALRAGTPFPVLELVGEQGSAKSTTQRGLRTFIDPNKVMLRSAPKTREDIFVAAGNNHVVSLENLSGLPPEYSDALCTVATGGGMAGRQFYTNDDENIIEAHNPVILNGIGAVITRSDLLDRAIVICPPTIEQRITEAEHDALLEQHAPSIMGGLLDLFVQTLAELPNVKIPRDQLPRMADFAYLGEAMHWVMGGDEFEFLERYVEHRKGAIQRTIAASPVAAACIKFLEAGRSFTGPVGRLLAELDALSVERERGDYWPRSPKGMGDSFRRVAPALRQLGIEASIESKPKRDGVHCVLRRGSYEVVVALATVPHIGGQSSQSSPMFTKQFAA